MNETCLVLNLSHGIRKSKTKTWCVHDVNAKELYYKNMITTKWKPWQRYLPKTNVEQIESTVGFYLYLYPLGT
jgi:hypothetical protein